MSEFTVRFQDAALNSIKTIASGRGISVSEAIRRSLAITLFITEQLDEGYTFYMENERERIRLEFRFEEGPTAAPMLRLVPE